MYTLDYDLGQLERLHDFIDSGQPIRIIHTLIRDEVNPDQLDFFGDRYIVLIECSEVMYTFLLLL